MSAALQLTEDQMHGGAAPKKCRGHAAPPGRDFFEWYEEMSKTHEQRPCPYCGLLAVWVPKKG